MEVTERADKAEMQFSKGSRTSEGIMFLATRNSQPATHGSSIIRMNLEIGEKLGEAERREGKARQGKRS